MSMPEFVKLEELPREIALVSRDEYRKKFQLPIHKAISEATKNTATGKTIASEQLGYKPVCNTLCACNK